MTYSELSVLSKSLQVYGELDFTNYCEFLLPSHGDGVEQKAVPQSMWNVERLNYDDYSVNLRHLSEGSVDYSIALGVFGHVDFFWELFAEMARVTRDGGVLLVGTALGGKVNRSPIDSWRFYPDAAYSLARYATSKGIRVNVEETFVLDTGNGDPDGNRWIGVFRIGSLNRVPVARVYEFFPHVFASSPETVDSRSEFHVNAESKLIALTNENFTLKSELESIQLSRSWKLISFAKKVRSKVASLFRR